MGVGRFATVLQALCRQGGWRWAAASSSSRCVDFWRRMSTVPYMRNHPTASCSNKWPMTVPLGMHGDSAPFTKLDSLWCLSWSSLLSPSGSPFDNRWVICTLPTPWMTHETKRQVAQVVAWSICCIGDGRFPDRDHLGRPWPVGSDRQKRAGSLLATGVCGMLVDCRADWPHHTDFFDFPAHNSVPEMRWLCHATPDTGPRPFTDVSSSAAWRATPRTTLEYEHMVPEDRRNAICFCPGWVLESAKVDECHSLKLGVARWTVACTLLNLCERGVFGPGSLDMQLASAWNGFKLWCQENQLQCTARRFTRARLSASTTDYPEISSKAMNTRIILGWLAQASVVVHLPTHAVPARDRHTTFC